MHEFNKRQKIILVVIAIVIMVFICYYVYSKDEGNMFFSDSELEIKEENIAEEERLEEEGQNETTEYSDSNIIVHVEGAVNKPGVYELRINSRIADAIEKAEGITQDAATNEINLAYRLEDGMKIYIPTRQEYEEQKKKKEESGEVDNIQYITTNSGLNDENDINSNVNNVIEKDSKVNINTATQTELETLPGIGPSTSAKIIEYRNKNGNFKNIEDLKNVNGIGDVKFDNIKDKIEI